MIIYRGYFVRGWLQDQSGCLLIFLTLLIAVFNATRYIQVLNFASPLKLEKVLQSCRHIS